MNLRSGSRAFLARGALALLASAAFIAPIAAHAQAAANAPGAAQAQDTAAGGYPNKPVRVVVPFAVGGTSDLLARLMAPPMSQMLGQTIIVDNRPGAGSNVGNDIVAKAAPDGYTVLLASPAIASNLALYGHLSYDPQADLTPVSLLVEIPVVLVVNPSTPFKSVGELIAYAKANPDKLNFGSSGNGGIGHLTGELFKSMTGVKMVHVPYKGNGPALTDLMAGTLSLAFSDIAGAAPFIQSGKLRPLGTASAKRPASLSQVPTMAEAGVPGFLASTWFGLFVPAHTPDAIVQKLGQVSARIMHTPAIAQQLKNLGAEPVGSTPAEFSQFVIKETALWSKVVKDSGAKVE